MSQQDDNDRHMANAADDLGESSVYTTMNSRLNNIKRKSVASQNVLDVAPVLDAPVPFDEAATRRLLQKLDLNLIPFMATIYL
jgi:hypothetical protein